MSLIGFPAAIGSLVYGWHKYNNAEIFLWFALMFLIAFTYHLVDEYYEFLYKQTGKRKYSNKQLINVARASIGVVVVYIIIRLFIG